MHKDKSDDSRAYEICDDITLVLALPRKFFQRKLTARVFDERYNDTGFSFDFSWHSSEGGNDNYKAIFSAKALGVGLYFLKIISSDGERMLYGHSEHDYINFVEESKIQPNIQLSVSDFEYQSPNAFLGGIIYHIFVDRFNRGGDFKCRNGAAVVDDWSCGVPEYPEYPGAPLKNNTFYGGTLRGIVNKLDYIASLGANIIYLSPIFESVSNHKYDTADYMTVDSMFGGDEELLCLIKECKKRNIKIILDGVFNHTGADSIYFNRYGNYNSVGAYQSKSSQYYDWYSFDDFPDKYTSWWGIEILPRINLLNDSCRKYFVGEAGVVEKYAKMGIDGFRLDVADELPDDFISEIKSVLSENTDNTVLYGEVWEDASNKIAYDKRKTYYLGNELDGVMNYPLRRGLIEYVKHGNTGELYYALTDVRCNAPKRITDAQMNLLGTHDTVRILTELAELPVDGYTNAQLRNLRMDNVRRAFAEKRLSALYTVIATLPGIPSVFYGDEAGLEGFNDPFNRMPYPWGKESKQLLSHYQKVGAIRRSECVYENGAFKLLLLTPELLIFKREIGNDSLITVFNNSVLDNSLHFEFKARELISNLTGNDFKLRSGTAYIFKIKSNTELILNNQEIN